MSLGVLATIAWSLMLVPKLTSQWTETYYGQRLENALAVWWGITWRSLVVALVAGVIMTMITGVAFSVQTAYKGSMVGALGGLMIVAVGVANVVVSVLATGWAMSRVAATQLSTVVPMTPAIGVPVAQRPASVEFEPARPAPRRAPVSVGTVAAPSVSEQGTRQCPKCGLHETERGSVIGLYCKVCGWREARR
jgi:hypothetical protein